MSTELTKQDRCDFNVLKAIVRKHTEAIFEAAAALKTIRDRKLWRGSHDSYDDFCLKELKFTHRSANRLISPPKLPDENPPNNGENGDLGQNVSQSGPDDTENVVSGEPNGVSGTEAEESPPSDPLPPQEFRDQFLSFMQIVSNLKRDLRKLAKQTGGEQLLGEMNILERGLDSIRGTIKFARPFAICPYCEGRDSDNCEACKGLGWLNEHQYHQAPKVVTT